MPKKDKKPKKKLKEGNQIFNIYHYSKASIKAFSGNYAIFIFLFLAKEEEKVEEKVEDKKEEVSVSSLTAYR